MITSMRQVAVELLLVAPGLDRCSFHVPVVLLLRRHVVVYRRVESRWYVTSRLLIRFQLPLKLIHRHVLSFFLTVACIASIVAVSASTRSCCAATPVFRTCPLCPSGSKVPLTSSNATSNSDPSLDAWKWWSVLSAGLRKFIPLSVCLCVCVSVCLCVFVSVCNRDFKVKRVMNY